MKNPFICQQHHEVLTAWSQLRRQLPAPPPVWSFDYHTDTMPCFRHTLPTPADGDWLCPERVGDAVSKLRHDEHFDWALRSGTVSRINLLCFYPPPEAPEHPELHIYPAPDFPDQLTALNHPESIRPEADNFLSSAFLNRVFGADLPGDEPFIMDIDCDSILTAKCLENAGQGLFAELLGRAALVTISKEDEWVRILKLPGEKISGGENAEKILKILQKNTSGHLI